MSIDESEELRIQRKKEKDYNRIEVLRLQKELAKLNAPEQQAKAQLKLLKEQKKPPKESGYKNFSEAFNAQMQKALSQRYKKEAKREALKKIALRQLGFLEPVGEFTGNLQQGIRQGIRREGIIRQIGSRAERIEQQLVSINEVKFLQNLESARMEFTSPPDKWLIKLEKSVTDSMPD